MMQFPNGRRFAFTILDDTDDATFENIVPIYDRLREYGFRTTKTVWPLDCPEGSQEYFAAETLQRPEYLSYVQQLVADGFELASHGATMESSNRERTLRGFEFLDRHFDTTLQLYANHGENRENVYWGAERIRTPLFRWLMRAIQRDRPNRYYCGELEGSEFFWGDVCRKRFRVERAGRIQFFKRRVGAPVEPEAIRPGGIHDPERPAAVLDAQRPIRSERVQSAAIEIPRHGLEVPDAADPFPRRRSPGQGAREPGRVVHLGRSAAHR